MLLKMQRLLPVLLFWTVSLSWAQTKVGGLVVDEAGDPVAFANVFFKNSNEGTITNENGSFYLESQSRYDTLMVSFIGYARMEIPLPRRVNLDMNIVLTEGEQLDEVVLFVGKQPKKKKTPMKSRLFKGMEFIFEDLDTSRITGKTYLPVFLNEKFTKVYGDNDLKLEKRDLLGNRNSGFSNNQAIIAFVQDLYAPYDIYDNYLKFFVDFQRRLLGK